MQKRRHSILWQITGIMVLSLFGVLLLLWLMNTLFLGRFYMSYKVSSMKVAFEVIDDAQEEGVLYDESYLPVIEKLCANENLSLMIISSDGTVRMTSQNENSALMDQFFDLMLDHHDSQSQVLSAEDDYTIQKRRDERTDNEYLTLWGTLGDGNLILLRSAMQSMTDAARLSNRLLLAIGLVSLAMGVVLSAVAAVHLTKPIYEMTEISKRMTELDFEAKYAPRRGGNELDVLGLRLNELSDALKKTILDLKQANTELVRDLRVREENETMRREFISNVSHELKTPLALIRGYAEGLSEGVFEDAEDRDSYLEIIIDETDKLSGMVQKLLSLNRLEYGTQQIHMDRVDLSELVMGTLSAHRLILEQNGIRAVYTQARPVYVWTDPALAEQVIENYFSNAVHYCAGDKRIEIRAAERETQIRLSVFNTGEPIDEAKITHLWEKFYKADEARTREYGGSGIGLSIVKAVAEGLNTHCGVENYENGVLFWFDFDS